MILLNFNRQEDKTVQQILTFQIKGSLFGAEILKVKDTEY
jgi:chemotaxis signal transduction protein